MGAKRFLSTGKASLVVAVAALFSTATALAEVRIVALGDRGIRGKGVSESQAYPAQLEAALRARGHQVTVTNIQELGLIDPKVEAEPGVHAIPCEGLSLHGHVA
jgi:hypothetical protein